MQSLSIRERGLKSTDRLYLVDLSYQEMKIAIYCSHDFINSNHIKKADLISLLNFSTIYLNIICPSSNFSIIL